MKCDRCNFENPENESYCINCGQKLPEKPMVTHIIVKFSNKIPENNENNNYYSVTYRGPDNSEINDTAYGCIKKTMKDNKKLFIAIILNLIVAGTGHLYLKRYYRGIIFLILTIGLCLTSLYNSQFVNLVISAYVIQTIDVIFCYYERQWVF